MKKLQPEIKDYLIKMSGPEKFTARAGHYFTLWLIAMLVLGTGGESFWNCFFKSVILTSLTAVIMEISIHRLRKRLGLKTTPPKDP